MLRVFADTSYWLALLNPRDALHQLALFHSKKIEEDKIVTSDLVLIEVLNGFCEAGPFLKNSAAKLAAQLIAQPEEVIFASEMPGFTAILAHYKAMNDKRWSFTDCASFLIMGSGGIHSALTHDRHFEQAGFEALLRIGGEA